MKWLRQVLPIVALALGAGGRAAAEGAAPASVPAARVSADFLRTVTPRAEGRAPKGQAGSRLLSARNRGGVPGIDSLTNFTDQFTVAGFDFFGNPQSVWPYEMVGRAPEHGGRR